MHISDYVWTVMMRQIIIILKDSIIYRNTPLRDVASKHEVTMIIRILVKLLYTNHTNSSSLPDTSIFIQLVKCENDSAHAQCIIWKNGILLVHSNLTRCVIEVTDQTTRLYITLQCEKGHKIYLVKQRSFLISLIKSLKKESLSGSGI